MKTLENLKLSLQDQRFPEDSVKSPFTVTDFILAELTLLLFSMENGRDAKDACFNLRKFELFGTLPPGEIMRRYYLARIKLKACSGQQKWNKMIENYMSSECLRSLSDSFRQKADSFCRKSRRCPQPGLSLSV